MISATSRTSYTRLAARLNKFPQGAPPSRLLYDILKILFSEQEARLVSSLPIKVFTARKAAAAWGMTPAKSRKLLDGLCKKALLVDMVQKGRRLYCLPPPMAGFLEFSMMRARPDLPQDKLAGLLHRYINVEEDFARELFTRGHTQLGRVYAHEPQIPEALAVHVLDYDRASHILRTASAIGISRCYCRHKLSHLHQACDAPQEICMTLNITAASLIRHGYARPALLGEALDLLEKARAHNLVQFGENVREQPNFLCHCCKCCCVGMQAARRFALQHPVHSAPFLPHFDGEGCSGCGKCTRHCPVDAIGLSRTVTEGGKSVFSVTIDSDICLGCGVCATNCPAGALTLRANPKRLLTPLNTAHRVVLMAIERNCLQHIVFDNQVLFSQRALAAFLGVLFKLPPAKQILASRQLHSRYLETIIAKLHWQPECN
ncbi:MAG: 4Fe-4S binding protein [Desulfosarcinaceae bacterium]